MDDVYGTLRSNVQHLQRAVGRLRAECDDLQLERSSLVRQRETLTTANEAQLVPERRHSVGPTLDDPTLRNGGGRRSQSASHRTSSLMTPAMGSRMNDSIFRPGSSASQLRSSQSSEPLSASALASSRARRSPVGSESSSSNTSHVHFQTNPIDGESDSTFLSTSSSSLSASHSVARPQSVSASSLASASSSATASSTRVIREHVRITELLESTREENRRYRKQISELVKENMELRVALTAANDRWKAREAAVASAVTASASSAGGPGSAADGSRPQNEDLVKELRRQLHEQQMRLEYEHSARIERERIQSRRKLHECRRENQNLRKILEDSARRFSMCKDGLVSDMESMESANEALTAKVAYLESLLSTRESRTADSVRSSNPDL